METHSSILAWIIPWTEEPDRLQSIGSHRVGYDYSNLIHRHEWKCVIPLKVRTLRTLTVMYISCYMLLPVINMYVAC